MDIALVSRNGKKITEPGGQDSPLAIRGLTVSYGEKPAVFSVDMTVEAGKMTAIIGPKWRG